jgi:hypothetical protein
MTELPRADRPLARGWATVDLDRAEAELDGSLAIPGSFRSAERSEALGARCRRGEAADGSGWIVLLEPDTEARIAGFLARRGEGWAATWMEVGTAQLPPGTAGVTSGPLGPERLEPGPSSGPFRLSVATATIER